MAGNEVFYIFPIRHRDSFKTHLITQQVGQNDFIGVHWDSIHFPTVDHNGHGPRINACLKGGHEVLTKLAFWNPSRRAVFAAQCQPVSQEMLQRRRNRGRSFLVSFD